MTKEKERKKKEKKIVSKVELRSENMFIDNN